MADNERFQVGIWRLGWVIHGGAAHCYPYLAMRILDTRYNGRGSSIPSVGARAHDTAGFILLLLLG